MDVRKHLDALIRERGQDYAYVARLIGRNPTYIQQFVKRGVPRRLSEEDRQRLAAHFGVSERSLGAPDGRALVESAAPAPSDDFVRIEAYDIGASAGPGALAEDERAQLGLAFPRSVVRDLASGDPRFLSSIRVAGDSMVPTLSDGDMIVVDANDAGGHLRDGVYVLRRDDTLLVKRLGLNPAARTLEIRSDNPTYPSFAGVDPDDVQVIGRVKWVGRRLD